MLALQSLRDRLAFKTVNPAEVIILADQYILSIATLGDLFRLPKEHVIVKPIIEEFAKDPVGFIRWVKSIYRDLERGSEAQQGLHAVIRRLEARQKQRESRELTGMALKVALEKGMLKDEFLKKQAYELRLRKDWEKRRATLLASHRAGAPNKRLSTDEQEVILKEFWLKIRAEIENGEVLKP